MSPARPSEGARPLQGGAEAHVVGEAGGGHHTTSRALRTLGVVAVLVLTACARQAPAPDPVRPVQMMQVSQSTVPDIAVYAGEIRPRHEGDLSFRIAGKLIARAVDVGARVRKGDALARLDPADVRLQTDAARAAVAAAATEHRFASAELDRYQNLFAQKFVSASALDQKRNSWEATRARLAQAEAQMSVTRNQADYATLTAEADGIVTAVNAEPGQVVAAGQAVLRIAREREREAAISVPEHRLAELKAASALAVVLWAQPTRRYAARIREIAPSVDPVTRTFAVRLSVLDADADVQWGMTANVAVQGRAIRGTWLPLSSIYRNEAGPAVWIFDPQTRQVGLRPVTLAEFREDGVLIASGLVAGEWVVTAGVHKLYAGQTVRPYATPAG